MFKQVALVLGLSLPLLALADGRDDKDRAQARAPAPAASRPAAVDADHAARAKAANLAQLDRVQGRGRTMSACQKQAADKQLNGPDRKLFVASCMNAVK